MPEEEKDLAAEEAEELDPTPEEESEDESEEEGEEEEEESEDEDVDWKAVALKEREEKENYKRGLLSAKAKNRTLDGADDEEETPPVEATPSPKQEQSSQSVDQIVEAKLRKQKEKEVIQDMIDPDSPHYLPELGPKAQFNEIVGFLPRSFDGTTPQGIRKALTIAVNSWKFANGVQSAPAANKEKEAKKILSSTSGNTGGTGAPRQPQKRSGERKFLAARPSMSDWYK